MKSNFGFARSPLVLERSCLLVAYGLGQLSDVGFAVDFTQERAQPGCCICEEWLGEGSGGELVLEQLAVAEKLHHNNAVFGIGVKDFGHIRGEGGAQGEPLAVGADFEEKTLLVELRRLAQALDEVGGLLDKHGSGRGSCCISNNERVVQVSAVDL